MFLNKLNKHLKHQQENDNKENVYYFVTPYVPTGSQYFNNIKVNNSNIRLAHRNLNQLSKYIETQKDRVPKDKQKNIVYRISCKTCDMCYIGQSKRQLHTRIKEHQYHVTKGHTDNSVLARHQIEHNHNFNWNDIEILDIESNFHKRITSEMLHIKSHKNTLNLMTDTESLDNIYIPVFDKIELKHTHTEGAITYPDI